MNNWKMLGADAIRVTDPFVCRSFRLEWDYLMTLDPWRLTAGFRETAGLPAGAACYGGWEETEIRGHTLGHYLSAMAQTGAATGDPAVLERIRQTLELLADCQREDGFLFASGEDLFRRVEQREPAWVPWYTMHKLLAGLLDVWTLTGCGQAKDILLRLSDWIAERVTGWSEEVRQTVLAVEYGGMNGVLYEIYGLTGKKRYLEAARCFDELPLFHALAENRDILNGLHANTTIPKILGGLKGYAVTGGMDPMYLQMAENFWEMVIRHHTYLSGGNSEWEHFGLPDILDGERTACNCETCNTYNMIKLSQLLFSLTGKKKYADYDAWAYVNTILSSQNHETGMTTYFQPMDTGFFKVYSRPYDQFWCCTGTGMENFTKPWVGIAHTRHRTLRINRLVSCEIRWGEDSLSLEADWIRRDSLRIRVRRLTPGSTVALRIPQWARGYRTKLPEGIPVREDQGYLLLSGSWQRDMTVEVEYPMELTCHGLPDDPRTVGYSIGPFMLSADLGTEDLQTTVTGVDVTVPLRPRVAEDYLLDPVLLPAGKLRQFRAVGADGRELLFDPHFLKNQVRYGIYFRVFRQGSPELSAYLQELRRRQSVLQQYDVIPLGNDQYELAHNIRGKDTDSFADDSGRGREIRAGGWVAYSLRIPEGKATLRLTFRGPAQITLEGVELESAETLSVPAWFRGQQVQLRISNPSCGETLRLYNELYITEDQDE